MTPFEIAMTQYGVRGVLGVGDNPEVLKYFKETGFEWVKDDDTAWCAAFLNWCLMKAGKPHTGSLMARSFLNYGSETKTPKMGDIVVIWRGAPNSVFGHAGFFIAETDIGIFILGGNQDNAVYIIEYPKTKLLGYRTIHA